MRASFHGLLLGYLLVALAWFGQRGDSGHSYLPVPVLSVTIGLAQS